LAQSEILGQEYIVLGVLLRARGKINTWLEKTFDPQNVHLYGLWLISRGARRLRGESPSACRAPGWQWSGTAVKKITLGLAATAANFENVTLVARWREHFRCFWVIFLVAQLLPKEVFKCPRIHKLLVNGVVTASSHAL